MKHPRQRILKDQDGRTVIELLVGLAMAGIVGVALSSIAVLGFRFAHFSQFEDQRVYPVRNGFDMVVKELRLAQSLHPNCNSQLGIGMLSPGATQAWVATYAVDGSSRLVRTLYTDASCTTVKSTTVLGYQITHFSLSKVGQGELDVAMRATSKDGTPFTLKQRVTGRVVGQ